jgi:hypothetical protein
MAEQGWTTRTARVLGHKDNPVHPLATGCPGDHLYPFVPAIGRRVAYLLAGAQEAPTVPVRNNPPLGPALDALAVVATYLACNPGGGSQAALWDVVIPYMTQRPVIPAGDPRRTEFEQAAQYPGNGRLAAAWVEILQGA